MSEGGGSGCLAHATDSGGDDLVRLGAKESGLDWCVHKIPPTGCARSGLLTSLKRIEQLHPEALEVPGVARKHRELRYWLMPSGSRNSS
jgi:hypothetical protein